MGRAFRRFLSDLDADGPKKKDGFDELNLRRLHFWERGKARTLLIDAIVRGDNTAVRGLAALDRNAAQPELESLLGDPRVDDAWVRVRIASELAAAGDFSTVVRSALDETLSSRDAGVRAQALRAIENAAALPERAAMLQRYLAQSSDNDTLYRESAAQHALAAAGRSVHDSGQPSYATLLEALTGNDADALHSALRTLDATRH